MLLLRFWKDNTAKNAMFGLWELCSTSWSQVPFRLMLQLSLKSVLAFELANLQLQVWLKLSSLQPKN